MSVWILERLLPGYSGGISSEVKTQAPGYASPAGFTHSLFQGKGGSCLQLHRTDPDAWGPDAWGSGIRGGRELSLV